MVVTHWESYRTPSEALTEVNLILGSTLCLVLAHVSLALALLDFGKHAGDFPVAASALFLYVAVAFTSVLLPAAALASRIRSRAPLALDLIAVSTPFLLGVALQGLLWATYASPPRFSPRIDPEWTWTVLQLITVFALGLPAAFYRQRLYLLALATLHSVVMWILPALPRTPVLVLPAYTALIVYTALLGKGQEHVPAGLLRMVTSLVASLWILGVVLLAPRATCQSCLPLAGAALPWHGLPPVVVPTGVWSGALVASWYLSAAGGLLMLAAVVAATPKRARQKGG